MNQPKQVLFNLLANALKFTPDGGQVTIEVCRLTFRGGLWTPPEEMPTRFIGQQAPASSSEEWVKVAVQDTGIGINAADLERIFGSFEQIDHVFTRRYAGTGLGLSLCRGMIKLHGGWIWAESDGEGKPVQFCHPDLI